MFRLVSKCQLAYKIWLTPEEAFVSETKAKTLHIRSLLQAKTRHLQPSDSLCQCPSPDHTN